jgi:hypothetical protein
MFWLLPAAGLLDIISHWYFCRTLLALVTAARTHASSKRVIHIFNTQAQKRLSELLLLVLLPVVASGGVSSSKLLPLLYILREDH